jgi:hypothetical protein
MKETCAQNEFGDKLMSEEQKKEDWDEVQQKIQQAEANAKKAKEEAEAAAADKEAIAAENAAYADQLEATQSKIEELKSQLKANEEKKEELQLDPDQTEPNVIKAITQLTATNKALQKELGEVKSYAEQHKQKEQQREAKSQEDAIVSQMCDHLDGKFDPKFRNDAIAMAKNLVKNGKEKAVTNGVEAMILMEKCYTQLSDKSKPKDSVNTDTGDGGITTPSGAPKQGTTQEVLADMRKDKSWLDEPLGTVEPDIF